MINQEKRDTTFYILISSFIVVFVLIGVWIQQSLMHTLREDNARHVALQASLRAQRVEENFTRELNDLIRLSTYLNVQGLDHLSLMSSFGANQIAKEGIIDLYGNLEMGESVQYRLFQNVRESLRGKPAISFAEGEGVLFTVPILKDGNVQYILYRQYNDQYVKSNFGLEDIENAGLKVNVVDPEDYIVVPFRGYSIEDKDFFKSPKMEKYKSIIRERMKLTNSAAIYFNSERGDNYLFMAEVPNTDLFLSGYISEEIVAGNVFNTIDVLLAVYIALILMISAFLYFYREDVNKRNKQLEERNAKVEQLSDEIMTTLALTIDAKDTYTNGHSQRVAKYAAMLAKKYGFSDEDCNKVRQLGLLHDIGKIGVPDAVLNKTAKLTDEEFDIIKSHTYVGSDILKTVSAMPDIWMGARWHHERFDGRGYPDKKSGEDIPIIARIIAVADSYDAMTSKRCYRDALPQTVVRAEIEKGSGSQFDPQIAKLMLKMIDEDVNYELRQK